MFGSTAHDAKRKKVSRIAKDVFIYEKLFIRETGNKKTVDNNQNNKSVSSCAHNHLRKNKAYSVKEILR